MSTTVVSTAQLTQLAVKQKNYIDAKAAETQAAAKAAADGAVDEAKAAAAGAAAAAEALKQEVDEAIETVNETHTNDFNTLNQAVLLEKTNRETTDQMLKNRLETLKENVDNLEIPGPATADEVAALLAIFEPQATPSPEPEPTEPEA